MIKRWQDWANYFLGLWVFGSPWLLEHSMALGEPGGGSRAMWNLWLAVTVISTVALNTSAVWGEWANFGLGMWLVASPWVLDFAVFPTILLMWNSAIFGALIFTVAGWALTEEPRRRRSAT
jgi:SPW repeat